MSSARNGEKRPFVVCHMLTSLDGKIDGDFFSAPQTAPALRLYGELRNYYNCQATMYGTATMLGGYADGSAPVLEGREAETLMEDYINEAGQAVGNYIVSIDPEGVLGFSDHLLAKKGRPAAHVIEVLTEKASCAYRAYLKDRGISYLSGGRAQVDFSGILERLATQFGIERLMAAGGGILNWSLLQEGLVDELSLVIAPVADGNTDSVSIFEQSEFMSSGKPAAFCLKGAKEMEGNVLWLRYEAVRT